MINFNVIRSRIATRRLALGQVVIDDNPQLWCQGPKSYGEMDCRIFRLNIFLVRSCATDDLGLCTMKMSGYLWKYCRCTRMELGPPGLGLFASCSYSTRDE